MEQLKAQEKASGEKEGTSLQAPLASSPSRTGAAFFDGMAGSWWRGAGAREGCVRVAARGKARGSAGRWARAAKGGARWRRVLGPGVAARGWGEGRRRRGLWLGGFRGRRPGCQRDGGLQVGRPSLLVSQWMACYLGHVSKRQELYHNPRNWCRLLSNL
jgi:hypothetical protein